MNTKFIKDFMELTRAYSIGTVLASCVVVLSYAHYNNEKFNFINFILLTIALCLINMGENLYDDLIDIKSQLKKGVAFENIKFNSFVPKARLILNKTYSIKKTLVILFILFLIPLLIGGYFVYFAGYKILYFMLAGIILTLLYPISSKFYLAEIIVGLIYGPLMIMGGYYALTQEFNLQLLYLSFAVMFATLQLLHAHSLMDWEFDTQSNRKTLCILSKNKNNALKILAGMLIIAYSIIIAGIITYNFNPHTLLVFMTLPIGIELIKSMKDYINMTDIKFEPKWYYGFFENWKEIKENKIDFFMYRFYLARNFSLFFALFLSIGAIL